MFTAAAASIGAAAGALSSRRRWALSACQSEGPQPSSSARPGAARRRRSGSVGEREDVGSFAAEGASIGLHRPSSRAFLLHGGAVRPSRRDEREGRRAARPRVRRDNATAAVYAALGSRSVAADIGEAEASKLREAGFNDSEIETIRHRVLILRDSLPCLAADGPSGASTGRSPSVAFRMFPTLPKRHRV